jgi:hypothetical protein
MIRHLFCPEDKFHVFEDIAIDHGRNPVCSKQNVGTCLARHGLLTEQH